MNIVASHRNKDVPSPNWTRWLWVIASLLLTFIVTLIGTAYLVRSALEHSSTLSGLQSKIIIKITEIPGIVRGAVKELTANGEPRALLLKKDQVDERHWIRRFPAPTDPGYLLFSGVDSGTRRSLVKLIRVADGATVAHWDPDWSAIYEHVTHSLSFLPSDPNTTLAIHPLLLPEGDIIFNSGIFLARVSPCKSKPVWVLTELMHHSNELGPDGSLWIPSKSKDIIAGNPWLSERITNDSLANVSIDGKVLSNKSFAQILFDNGLSILLLGTFNARNNTDRIHLNQITSAPKTSRYWQQGDLLISSRHLSTVFLYRPSTGKIFWHQQGPWMNQHSVDFVGDHQISVFDNNNLAGVDNPKHAFIEPDGVNRVFLHDFDTNQDSQPFATMLAKARPMTLTQGRARMLPDGGLFVEETNSARHLRFTRDRLLWSRVNDYDDKFLGALAWSRYLTADEARGPLQALGSKQCPSNPIKR